MEEAFWAARQGDALLHTSLMADVLGAVLEVAATVVIDALIVGTTSLLATSAGITMGCTAVVLTGFVAGVSRSGLAAKVEGFKDMIGRAAAAYPEARVFAATRK